MRLCNRGNLTLSSLTRQEALEQVVGIDVWAEILGVSTCVRKGVKSVPERGAAHITEEQQ